MFTFMTKEEDMHPVCNGIGFNIRNSLKIRLQISLFDANFIN